MTGLGDLFDEAEGRAAREAAGAKLEGEQLGSVHTRVRRAHARRSALQASLVAVAVVIVGAGVAYGVTRGGPAEVADSPSPTASESASPSPSATPSPSETGFAWPGFAGEVTVDPHLPTASAITPEVWAGTGPGWVLVSYRESWVGVDAEGKGPQVIYLVSPAGERYELVNVTGDTVSVLAWRAGSATAPVSVQPDGDAPFFGMLDLVTGEVAPMDGYAPYMWSLAFLDSDGVPIWRGNDATSAYVSIAPDGTQGQYAIPAEDGAADLATEELGKPCLVVAPFDEQSVLVECHDDPFADGGFSDESWYLARVNAAEGVVDVLLQTAPGESLRNSVRSGESAITALGDQQCDTSLAAVSNGAATPIPGTQAGLVPVANNFRAIDVQGDAVTWTVAGGCASDPSPPAIGRTNLRTGAYALLVPFPQGRPEGERPELGTSFESVTGVAVAH